MSEGGVPLGTGLAAQPRDIEGSNARERQIAVPERNLVRRTDHGIINALVAALGGRIEAAQAIDLVAKELDAQGPLVGAGPHIDDPAASAQLAGTLDGGRGAVALPNQRAEQCVLAQHLTQTQGHTRSRQLLRRKGRLEQSLEWGDDHEGGRRRAHTQSKQHPQPAGDYLVAGRRVFIRHGIAGGVEQHRSGAKPLAQIVCGAQSGLSVDRDIEQGGAGVAS